MTLGFKLVRLLAGGSGMWIVLGLTSLVFEDWSHFPVFLHGRYFTLFLDTVNIISCRL